MNNNGKFVFYESVLKTAQHIESAYGTEAAYHYLIAIIEYGCYGLIPAENDPVWAQGFESVSASISAAADRYAKAQKDGARGGRARKQVGIEEILELQNQHLTQDEIAAQLNISRSTVARRLREYKASVGDEDVNQCQNTPEIMTQDCIKTTTDNLTHQCVTKCGAAKTDTKMNQNTTAVLTHQCVNLDVPDETDTKLYQNNTAIMTQKCVNKSLSNSDSPCVKTGQRIMTQDCVKTQLNYDTNLCQNVKRVQNLTNTITITNTKTQRDGHNDTKMCQNATVDLTQKESKNDTVKELLERPRLTEAELDYLAAETDLEFTIFNNIAISGDKEWEIINEK